MPTMAPMAHKHQEDAFGKRLKPKLAAEVPAAASSTAELLYGTAVFSKEVVGDFNSRFGVGRPTATTIPLSPSAVPISPFSTAVSADAMTPSPFVSPANWTSIQQASDEPVQTTIAVPPGLPASWEDGAGIRGNDKNEPNVDLSKC